MQNKPGQPLAAPDHPAAKLRWDKVKVAETTNGVYGTEGKTIMEKPDQVEIGKAPGVSISVEPVLVTAT
jgi:hypothetical protein